MEKKRKLPARAAARVEQASKKRTATPPDNRSVTPTPAPPPPAPAVEEPPPPQPLPKAIHPGKPLPVVDDPQPEDLSNKDYQSIQESGVLGDSLQRSRQKWISEGIFEKYWTKPTKRKGILVEEPNNPPKDSMTKLGAVTIFAEPHVFEAYMYAIKELKPPAPPASVPQPPIIQYGPPNGKMPPPPPPSSTSTPPTPKGDATKSPDPGQPPAAASSEPQKKPEPTPPPPQKQEPQRPPSSASSRSTKPSATSTEPRAPESTASAPPPPHPVDGERRQDPTPVATTQLKQPSPSPAGPSSGPHSQQSATTQPSFPSRPPPPPAAAPGTSTPANSAPASSGVGASRPAGTDPIIVMLAEKATEDPQLRDLMRRVAHGQAPKEELDRFQAIIDQITLETKRKGSVQGPSADRLLVNGRTVRYFADEVRTILDIVLASNPKQTSANLNPPARSDPLVVMLVKDALDNARTRDIVRRIAEERPQFTDATDLKLILDGLNKRLLQEQERKQKTSTQNSGPSGAKTNGVSNGAAGGSATTSSGVQNQSQPAPQQALRSKGPPPPPKPDISAIVFEFTGTNGDRYLFPKFSILEFIQGPNGQPQLLASFLIVRKGSNSEYGGDPNLDYYQPVTIRLQASLRLLEQLKKVVAPVEEVKRYMNDVMDNMTRAEYVLLAMRLPRSERDEKEGSAEKEATTNGAATNKSDLEIMQVQPHDGVLWTTKAAPASSTVMSHKHSNKVAGEDEQYQKLIASVTPMETDSA